MARHMPYRCSACGATHFVPRALAVTCPVCYAHPGERCHDLRAKDPNKPRITEHAERLDRLPE